MNTRPSSEERGAGSENHRFITNGRSDATAMQVPANTSTATFPTVGGCSEGMERIIIQSDNTESTKSIPATVRKKERSSLDRLLTFWLWVMSPINGLIAGLVSWYCFHFSTASTHLGMCVMAAIVIAAITAHNALCALNRVRIESMPSNAARAVSAQQSGKERA